MMNLIHTKHQMAKLGEFDRSIREMDNRALAKDCLIITFFDENVSPGLIRLKLGNAIHQMSTVFGMAGKESAWPS